MSQAIIPVIPLGLYLLTASSQPHLSLSAMIEPLLESPLPCFLASSTAYALITSAFLGEKNPRERLVARLEIDRLIDLIDSIDRFDFDFDQSIQLVNRYRSIN
jgi:hypothetical protein